MLRHSIDRVAVRAGTGRRVGIARALVLSGLLFIPRQAEAQAGVFLKYLGQTALVALGATADLDQLFDWPTGVTTSLTVTGSEERVEWTLLHGSLGIWSDEIPFEATLRGLIRQPGGGESVSDFWFLKFLLVEGDAPDGHETVTMTGFVQHTIGLHGSERAAGPHLGFDHQVSSRPGAQRRTGTASANHPVSRHNDHLTGWEAVATANGEDIDAYRFHGVATHVVPEPASVLLLGSGMVMLGWMSRRRKRVQSG